MKVTKCVNTYIIYVDYINVTINILTTPLCDSPQVVYGVQSDIYKMIVGLGQFFNPSHKNYMKLTSMNKITKIAFDMCMLRCKLLEFYNKYHTINKDISCNDQLEILDTCVEVLERKMR